MSKSRTSVYWLSVNLLTGDPKIGRRQPGLGFGTAVYKLELKIPTEWTQPLGTIELDMPAPPDEAIVSIRQALGVDDDDD